MRPYLPPNVEKELQECLQLFDPIISQSFLSYAFCASHEWKLEIWKKIFIHTSTAVKDFIIPIKEVQSVVNTVLRHSEALHVLPPESLKDVSRSLVNNRTLLLTNSLLPHLHKPWEDSGSTVSAFKRQSVRLGPPKPEVLHHGWAHSIGQMLSSITTAALSPFISVSAHNPVEEQYVVKPERRLPYREPYCTEGIPLEETVIVVTYLENLVQDFLYRLRFGNLHRSNVLAKEGPTDICIVPLPCILPFLESQIRNPITTDHVQIFIWFLTFLSTSSSRPFECSLGVSDAKESTTKFRAIKISFDPQCREKVLAISDTDRAALLERFADETLNEKKKDIEDRIVAADEECKRYLKLKNQEAALRALKKKKMAEAQIEALQLQMLKIEEAKQMRDTTQSIGLVASVVQTAVRATKDYSVRDGQRVRDILGDFQQSMDEVKKVEEALSEAAALKTGTITSESLEDEYNRLMAKEVEQALLSLVEVPSHPPGAMVDKRKEEEEENKSIWERQMVGTGNGGSQVDTT